MDELKSRYRTAVIIVAAQVATIAALTAAAWFDVLTIETTASPATITALWVAVIFIAVGSFGLRRAFFNWEKLTETALLKGKSGLIKKLRSNAVILSALAEIIAVLGFAIFILSGDKFQMLRAAAIALIVCLINFPRRNVWEKIVGNLEKLAVQR